MASWRLNFRFVSTKCHHTFKDPLLFDAARSYGIKDEPLRGVSFAGLLDKAILFVLMFSYPSEKFMMCWFV